jgi:hypothetical protein
MATSTPVYTARTIVASTTNAAGSTTRGTLDLRGKYGCTLTYKITNGAAGPSAQCEAKVLIAHNDGSTPNAASAGSDWKTVSRVGGGTANSAVTEWSIDLQCVQHVEVEFTGNTGQSVTVEAYATEFTSVTSA